MNPDLNPTETGNRQAIDGWLQQLSSDDRAIREQAMRHLVAEGETVVPDVLQYAVDQSNEGRSLAIRALGIIGDSSVVAELLPLLQDDDATIRANTAVVLGQLGHRSAVESLRMASRDSNARVRAEVRAALKMMGVSTGEMHMKPRELMLARHLQELRDSPPVVRQTAIQALIDIGEPAVPGVIAMLGESEPAARQAAIAILSRVGGERAAGALLATAHQDPDPALRKAAKTATVELAAIRAAMDDEEDQT